MAAAEHPMFTWGPIVATEAISAGMLVKYDGAKATAGSLVIGVAQFDCDSGDKPTLQSGLVTVLTASSVSAGDSLSISATAGKVKTAVAGEIVVGVAQEAGTGATSVKAFIFQPGSGGVALPMVYPTAGEHIAQIANAGVAYFGGGVGATAGVITSIIARFKGGITKGSTGVTIDVYRVRAGVAVKTATATAFATAGANYTALADWDISAGIDTSYDDVAAGDQFYATITNNTGAAIDPYVAWVALA